MTPTRVAVLDANVLYGIEVTDLLLTMAAARLYRPVWSPQILDEVARNLKVREDLDPVAIERRIAAMNRALPAALEQPSPELIEMMPVNAKDRHVLALVVIAEAPVIVTENLRDFPTDLLDSQGVTAIGVDAVVLEHVDHDRQAMVAILDVIARRRRRPPRTPRDIVGVLRTPLPRAMAALASEWSRAMQR